MRRKPLHLLEGIGLELEYMIVHSDSLEVFPVADELLRAAAGRYTCDFDGGTIGWSNELALHVMELKNISPVSSVQVIADDLQSNISAVNDLLAARGGCLMPTGMHPWMDPSRQTRLWHRRNRKIYERYDQIFGCRAHGWANVQSVHLNVSFYGDKEFRRLHSAIRLLLPIMPALAASSPVVEGKITGLLDNRLVFYAINQQKIPSITGGIIPEVVFTRKQYESGILRNMFDDIAMFDADGMLRHEWLNSRGAVPRFSRKAIEVRLLDVQECPLADLAISVAVMASLRSLISEEWSGLDEQESAGLGSLQTILGDSIRDGENAVIRDSSYLRTLGFQGRHATAAELWRHLADGVFSSASSYDARLVKALRIILERGPLSRRLLRALENNPSRRRIKDIYRTLCDCLARGQQFLGPE